jgi:hypothetical protein
MTMNSDAATEIKALWASQEMLIHSNDALQKELAEFRELFEAKLPAAKNQSLAKAKLMEAVRYLKDNYDKTLSDMNPRLVLHEFRALDKLVTGADGWTLDHISHQINKAYIDSDGSDDSMEDDFIEHYLWRKEL